MAINQRTRIHVVTLFFCAVLGGLLATPAQAAVCRFFENMETQSSPDATQSPPAEERCEQLQSGDTNAQSNACQDFCRRDTTRFTNCRVEQSICGQAAGVQDEKLKAFSIPLLNPLGSKYESDIDTVIPNILGNLIKNALGLIGILTLIVFIFGGFVWLTSAGNEDKVALGTRSMTYAAIGICIIFSSYAILQLLFSAFR